jgi:hypothetical protein
VSFVAITLCVASQQVFVVVVVVVYLVLDLVRKLLDTPSYLGKCRYVKLNPRIYLPRFRSSIKQIRQFVLPASHIFWHSRGISFSLLSYFALEYIRKESN